MHYSTRLMLQSADPEASLEKLLDNQKQNRQFVGPEAWLDALRELKLSGLKLAAK